MDARKNAIAWAPAKTTIGKPSATVGDFKIVSHKQFQELQKVKGRFSEVIFDDHVTIEAGNILEKQNNYQHMLQDMIADQWLWIKDHNHICVIDSNNAIQSLKIAEEATQKAQIYQPG